MNGLLRGVAWSLAGAAVSRAFLLLGSVVVGRLLGVLEFGKFGLLQSTVGLFGALAGATLGVTATRFIAHARGQQPAQAGAFIVKAYRLGLASGGTGALVAAVLAPLLGGALLHAPELVPTLRLSALLVFFGALNGVQNGMLAGLGAFRPLAFAAIVRGVVSCACMALGALQFGLIGAVAGQLAAELLSTFLFHTAVVRSAREQQITLAAGPAGAEAGALFSFALPTLLATIALQPVLWSCSVLLANQPNGFTEVGLFTAAERWRQVLLFIPASLSANVLSTLSRLEGEGKLEEYQQVFRRSLSLILLAVVGPGLVLAALAPVCLGLYGESYRSGALTLTVLIASCVPVALNNSLGQLLQSRGLAWWRFAIDVVMSALLLAVALKLIPARGATGYALAQLAAYAGAVFVLALVLFSLRTATQPPGRPLLIHLTTIPGTLRFLRGQPGFMQRAGFDVEVISSPGKQLEEFSSEQQVKAWPLPMARRIAPLSDLVSLCRLTLLLRQRGPTIVHAHTPKAGLLGMLAATLARTPVRIYHLHGLPLETARGLKARLLSATESIACALSHRVLAVSSSLRALVVRLHLVAPEKIAVPANGSANGVDAEKTFNAEVQRVAGATVRTQLGIPQDAMVIGFVGRIVRDKGVIELSAAWRRLRERFADARLLIIGPIEEADAVPKETLDELRADPRVHLPGARWEIAPFMAAMDVLVLPSHREGFGYVLLEAGAMGLPTVATRTTGCIDAVADGKTGSLFTPLDVAELEAAIARYLGSSELRRAHGEAGRARALSDFDQGVVWRALLSEYELQLSHVQAGAGVLDRWRLARRPLNLARSREQGAG